MGYIYSLSEAKCHLQSSVDLSVKYWFQCFILFYTEIIINVVIFVIYLIFTRFKKDRRNSRIVT